MKILAFAVLALTTTLAQAECTEVAKRHLVCQEAFNIPKTAEMTYRGVHRACEEQSQEAGYVCSDAYILRKSSGEDRAVCIGCYRPR